MFKRIFKKLKKNIPKVEKNRKKKWGRDIFILKFMVTLIIDLVTVVMELVSRNMELGCFYR